MAAALGLPVIALFGPTDPKIWAPKESRVVVHPEGNFLLALFPRQVFSRVGSLIV